MNNLLSEHDSNNLFNAAFQSNEIATAFEIVKSAGATFGVDGDQYYYGFGELPEPTGVYGFGKTPMAALMNFLSAFYSQTATYKNSK